MRLDSNLKTRTSPKIEILVDGDFFGIQLDARQVQKNDLFAAIRGSSTDGHLFIDQAIQNGAGCILISDEKYRPQNFNGGILVTDQARAVVEMIAAIYYQKPSQKLFCVGVTGTNGKTSTTYLLEHFFNNANCKMGVIGTINHHCGEQVWQTSLTTPDPVNLQSRLSQFIELNAKALAIEVSSHALDQSRVDSIDFDCAIFSNLTRDHLDYHKSMEDYFLAKQKLFNTVLERSSKKNKYAIINVDDPYGNKISISHHIKKLTYGQSKSDLQFAIKSADFTKTVFNLKYQNSDYEFILPMIGAHNIYNVVSAIGAALCYGISIIDLQKSIQTFRGVPGRLQLVASMAPGPKVYIDYAHSPDALENVLVTLNKINQNQNNQYKVWTIFGCGGDRDKGKRPQMAQIAQKYSDFVMVTSDNPRTESATQIIEDIKSGLILNEQVQIEEDRFLAIKKVILQNKMNSHVVILIAGKGHEDYQIIGTTKHHFSDYETALKLLLS